MLCRAFYEKERNMRGAGMRQMCADKGVDFYCPPPILCTDNAAMIGSAAYYEYRKGQFSGLDLNAVPGLRLGQR